MLKSGTAFHDLSYDGLRNKFVLVNHAAHEQAASQFIYTDGFDMRIDSDGKQVPVFGNGKAKGKGKGQSRQRASKRRPMTYCKMIGMKRGKEEHNQTEYYVKHGMCQLFEKYREPHPMLDQII